MKKIILTLLLSLTSCSSLSLYRNYYPDKCYSFTKEIVNLLENPKLKFDLLVYFTVKNGKDYEDINNVVFTLYIKDILITGATYNTAFVIGASNSGDFILYVYSSRYNLSCVYKIGLKPDIGT